MKPSESKQPSSHDKMLVSEPADIHSPAAWHACMPLLQPGIPLRKTDNEE